MAWITLHVNPYFRATLSHRPTLTPPAPLGVGFSYSSNPTDYQNYNDTIAATDNAA